jgi:choline dehydrogenase
MVDYVIVGAGSAGCVLAHRLSEDPACQVVLLEAGGPDTSPFSRMPGGNGLLQDTHYDWAYRTVPQAHLYNRRIFFPRGRVLGGSSTINFMIYTRGNRGDYDNWARLGNDGWSYEEVLPYFIRSEANQRFQDLYHGNAGPISVSSHPELHPLSEIYLEAAEQVGLGANPDFNGERQEGFGRYQMTCKDGERCSAADGYLVPAMQRNNLQVVIGVLATRILFENNRATAVEHLSNAGLQHVHADVEVLLCGGAINSPQLLMLSGIGPADELGWHSIDARADLPGVGASLHDHIAAYLRCTTTVAQSFSALPAAEKAAAHEQYARSRSGPLASNFLEVGAYTHTDRGEAYPDLQHFLRTGLAPDYPEGPHADRHGLTLATYVSRPKSHGRLRLATASPFDKPLIDPNYFAEPDDMRRTIAGIRLNRRILAAPAFEAVRGEELTPGPGRDSDDEIEDYVRRTASTTWHPMGTCKMGVDDMAVVDPSLRVRGLDRLRVIDASVMPEMVSGNLNAPTMMIAEKAADLIRATAP